MDTDHHWSPLTVTQNAQVRLDVGGSPLLHTDGRIYHDRNASRRALHDLGIDHWIWGRSPHAGGDRIHYLLWGTGDSAPRAIGVDVGLDGQVRQVELEVELGRWRPNLYGFRGWYGLTLRHEGKPWLDVSHRRVMEDGPFYQRFELRSTMPDGEVVRGIGEAVRPDRVDLDRHRPLVRMSLHHLAEDNPDMVAWFVGTKKGRWGRVFQTWFGEPIAELTDSDGTSS
jgi:hypothetical protein